MDIKNDKWEGVVGNCPTCNFFNSKPNPTKEHLFYKEYSYCKKCGQLLDWRDE